MLLFIMSLYCSSRIVAAVHLHVELCDAPAAKADAAVLQCLDQEEDRVTLACPEHQQPQQPPRPSADQGLPRSLRSIFLKLKRIPYEFDKTQISPNPINYSSK